MELGSLLGAHPVTVVLQGAADLPGALLKNHRAFLGSCHWIQLSLGIDIFKYKETLPAVQSNSSAMPLWVNQKISP